MNETKAMNDCIFCKIVSGDIPSEKIYEDEATFAFLDINPNSVGHTLVIPKEHFENIHDISENALNVTMKTVKKISGAIKKSLNADGLNIATNNGKAAGQVVFHTHVHIIPRYIGDHERAGRHISYKEGEMKQTAKKIIAALKEK